MKLMISYTFKCNPSRGTAFVCSPFLRNSRFSMLCCFKQNPACSYFSAFSVTKFRRQERGNCYLRYKIPYITHLSVQEFLEYLIIFILQVKDTETFWKWLMNDTIPVLLYDPFDKTPNDGRRHFLNDGFSYVLGTAIVRQQRIHPGGTLSF